MVAYYTNGRIVNAISISTAASNAISTGLMTATALWFENSEEDLWKDRINAVVAGLQLVTFFCEFVARHIPRGAQQCHLEVMTS